MERKALRILACVKVLHQLTSERGFDAMKRTLDPDYLVRRVNPADEHALETSLQLKERTEKRGGLAEIIVLSIASAADECLLRNALAMGADRAYRVWEEGFGGLNAMAAAYLLSAAVKKIGADVVVSGKRSLDMNGNEVAGYLAEFLHLPHLSDVTSADLSQDGERLVCRRRVEKLGQEVVETPIPALLSVERAEREPRYPTVYAILEWQEKRIDVLDRSALEADSQRLESLTSVFQTAEWTRPRPKKIFTPRSDLPPEERMKLAMSGGMETKKASFLKGDADKITEQVVDLLFKQKLLKKIETK